MSSARPILPITLALALVLTGAACEPLAGTPDATPTRTPPLAAPSATPTPAQAPSPTPTASTDATPPPTPTPRPTATPTPLPTATPTAVPTPTPTPRPTGLTLVVTDVAFAVGGTGQASVRLLNVTGGVAGFVLNVVAGDGTVARVSAAALPGFGLTDIGPLPAASVQLRAADLNSVVEGAASDVLLATLTLEGLAVGSASLLVSVTTLDDDAGAPLTPQVQTATVTVSTP